MGAMTCPTVEREELVNACGVDDFHDGANVVRTACIVGMAKARDAFEPVLAQLGYRLAHVQRRMLPISMYLLQKEGARLLKPTGTVHALSCASFSLVRCHHRIQAAIDRAVQGSTCTGMTSS